MKARFTKIFDKIFYTPQPLPPCSISSVIEIDGQPNRSHLRIDHEGNSILVLNAATVLHLNQTATEIAYYLAKQMPNEAIIEELNKRYNVSAEIAAQDIDDLKTRITALMQTADLDPETFLDMDRVGRHTSVLSAPLRMDCALTYQTTSEDSDNSSPVDRIDRYLETEDWKKIISAGWDWGIPHVIFTGGEPTLRPDLPELIEHAENLGQVSGLITDGFRLAEKDYLALLLDAGLDHLMIILNEDIEQSWESIRDSCNENIHLSVHFTIRSSNKLTITSVLDKLQNIGVKNLSLSSPDEENVPYMLMASQRAIERGFNIVYELPVPYSELNPVSLELKEDKNQLEGAARTWIYIEPDGDVLPAQGVLHSLGNLIRDSWMVTSAHRKEYLAKQAIHDE